MISEKDFGTFITKKRKELNLSQVALAEKLYVDPKTLSKWENGSCYPDLKSIYTMFKLFNVSLDGLIDDSIEKEIIRNKDISIFDKSIFWATVLMSSLLILFKNFYFYNIQIVANVSLLSGLFILNLASVVLISLENRKRISKNVFIVAKIIYILSAVLLYLL